MSCQMDYEIILHEQPLYAMVRSGGIASVKGFARILAELSVMKQYSPGIGYLLDIRELDLDDFSVSSLLQLLDYIENCVGAGKVGSCATVVSHPVAFGIARMYGLYGGERLHADYNVFYSLDHAVLWLVNCLLIQKSTV